VPRSRAAGTLRAAVASVLEFGIKRVFNVRRFEFVTPGIKQVFLWITPVRADARPELSAGALPPPA
jgi:hypothetical protein